jgi:hypothetical protein
MDDNITFYKELKELDEKIHKASALRDVTSHRESPAAFEARTDELKVLIGQELMLLEKRHEYLSVWKNRIKEETDKLLSLGS